MWFSFPEAYISIHIFYYYLEITVRKYICDVFVVLLFKALERKIMLTYHRKHIQRKIQQHTHHEKKKTKTVYTGCYPSFMCIAAENCIEIDFETEKF